MADTSTHPTSLFDRAGLTPVADSPPVLSPTASEMAAWTATEWTALGSFLSGAGTIIGALAVIGAAWFGSRTFESWRKQKLSERRIEQAERILTATYKVRRALGYVRHPLMRGQELGTAEEQLKKPDNWSTITAESKQKLILVQAYYNRLNAELDERRAIDECQPMARALFGQEVEKALDTLNHQFHIVRTAVESNISDGNDREFQRSIDEVLFSVSGTDKPNKMNDVIEAQVKLIEGACLPVLRLEK